MEIYNLILEAIIVGVYTFMLSSLIKTYSMVNIFFIGFIKHLLFGIIGIHNMYCENKEKNCKFKFDLYELALESILEGILFIIAFSFIDIKNPIAFFLAGFSIHIFFEILNIHNIFCKIKCE